MKNLVLLNLLLVILIVAVKVKAIENDKETQLENLSITMNLVKFLPSGDVIKICWPDEPVDLTAETVPVAGKTINELLRDNNIVPDAEAYAVVYALNPNVKKLSEPGVAGLRIPKAQAGKMLSQLFEDSFRVLITLDKSLKKQFGEEVKRWNELSQKISALETNKFADAETKTIFLKEFETISNVLEGINKRVVRRAGRPVPSEVLKQVKEQTELLNTLLVSVLPAEQKFGITELEPLGAVRKDLEIKVKALTDAAAGEAPPRWPEVIVIVKTLKEGQQISNLRIYYTPEALKNKPEKARSFGILSSPSNQPLPEADYCFWAARDPQKTAVTGVQCREIRESQGTIEVQLTVNP